MESLCTSSCLQTEGGTAPSLETKIKRNELRIKTVEKDVGYEKIVLHLLVKYHLHNFQSI